VGSLFVMRKRIITGLVVMMVVGATVVFMSQPKKGSLEWHKREYLRARDGSRLVNNLKADWYRMGGPRPKPRVETSGVVAEMEIHERALMALGYMEERTLEARFGGEAAARALWGAFAMNATLRSKVIVERPMARVVQVGSDFVVVRSARQDMPKWEAIAAHRRARGQ